MFWQNFLYYCNQIGKPPNVVAAEIGVKSSGTVTGWKNGAAPRPQVVAKLAEYFHIPVEALTGSGSALTPDETQLLEDYRGFSYAGRGLVRDFIEKMKAAGIYAYGVDPMMLGFNSDSYGQTT